MLTFDLALQKHKRPLKNKLVHRLEQHVNFAVRTFINFRLKTQFTLTHDRGLLTTTSCISYKLNVYDTVI